MTRRTCPSPFCSTRMSRNPMKAIAVGWFNPRTTSVTWSAGSVTVWADPLGGITKKDPMAMVTPRLIDPHRLNNHHINVHASPS